MPTKNCVRRKKRTDFIQYFSARDFAFDCQTSTLIVVEQDSLLSEFFLEHGILGTKVFNDFLLLAIDPTGKENRHQMPWL